MRKAKQIGSLALAVLMLMAMIGCGPAEPADTTPPLTTEPELQGQLTEPTTPATVPSSTPSKPQQPSDPTAPSSPAGNEGQSQGGNETPVTQPTEPPATVPVTTAPTPTEHTHSYTDTVVAATCSAQGYTRHTCSCGHSYDDGHTAADPNAHSYVQHVRQPTCAREGVTYYVCSGCGSSYLDEDSFTSVPHTPTGGPVQVVEPTVKQGYTIYHCSVCDQDYYTDYVNPTEEQKQAFVDAVVDATVKYINQFRAEEGTPATSVLPGLTLIAEYRAVQLQTNFAHDTAALREATAYYQYGQYIDGTLYGGTQKYYDCHGREAIYAGNPTGNADSIGYNIASAFRGSSGHWSYVGGADYIYIAVGVNYDPRAMGGSAWKCCILMSRTNQYG